MLAYIQTLTGTGFMFSKSFSLLSFVAKLKNEIYIDLSSFAWRLGSITWLSMYESVDRRWLLGLRD